MFKKLLIITLLLSPCFSKAQNDTSLIAMQMRNGAIYFDNAYALNAGLKKEELYNRALKWFDSAFAYPGKYLDTVNKKKGEIIGTGIFKIITSTNGHYYWLRFTVNIIVHNATYELKAYNFYEKPIEPGISNEYSKIEYRWWDFRQGKPWSAEDAPLFKGLRADVNEMTASLQKEMGRQQ